MRKTTLGGLPSLVANARPPGGILVRGSERNEVGVEARLRIQAETEARAKVRRRTGTRILFRLAPH